MIIKLISNIMEKLTSILILIFAFTSQIFSQVINYKDGLNIDTIFVFTPGRKLLTMSDQIGSLNNAAGIELFFSNSGFAVGGFYQYNLDEITKLGTRFFISGARNTDEIEFYDFFTGNTFIPNKVNRLYLMPLTVNITRYLFTDILHRSLKPYVSAGVGPAFILSTPYNREFFNAFNYAKWYTRFGGNIGFGAVIGLESSSYLGVNVDYYYIPFGSKGLESIRDKPIKTFGGLFLSLAIGTYF